ncbi:hypothetical protein V2O64_12045 [Verrucomicrobiaceae bacterium 227]
MKFNHPTARVLQMATVLCASPLVADTNLLNAGDLNTFEGWDNGQPDSLNPGIIATDGTNGTTVFGLGADVVVTQTDGTITSADGFNLTSGIYNLEGGTINTRYFLANGSTFNLSGGLVELSDGVTARHMGSGIGGAFNVMGSVVLDGTFATTVVQTGGPINIDSDWSGSWTWGIYEDSEWRDHFTNSEMTLDGLAIDGATFDSTFFVTNNGRTLSLVVDVLPTSLVGGDLLTAGSWTNGLPVSPVEGTVAVDGSLDDGNAGLADWHFTMTAGTITAGQDWNFTGASNLRIRGGTLDVTGDILASDASAMVFSGGTIGWGGDFEPAGTPGGTIKVSDGSFTGNRFGNIEGGTVTLSGGMITATSYDFSAGATTLGGETTLTGASGTFGSLDIERDWSGSFTVTGFSANRWETEFTSGNITLAGDVLDATGFTKNFSVSADGQILTFNSVTELLEGDIAIAASWNNGLPSATTPGAIAVDGILGTTVFGFGGGATIDQTAGTLISNDGFNFIRGDTWNMSGGKIVARYILSNGQAGVDTVMNISGGILELSDVEGNQHMGVGNGGVMRISGSAVLDGTHATLEVQTGGTLDIASDWTGSWTWGFYTGNEWQDHFVAGNITYDGAILDEAGFLANFSVSEDGMTLSPTGKSPEISEIVLNSDRRVTLTWNSQPGAGRSYAVRFSSDLSLPIAEWPDDNDSIATGGSTTTYTTFTTFNGDKMFFVVVPN